MLIDKGPSRRRNVAEVVIHELAHQWFGNLVTMEQWEDLWLSEGLPPGWRRALPTSCIPPGPCGSSLLPICKVGSGVDALRSSHDPSAYKKSEEVEQVFDAISYCKGGQCKDGPCRGRALCGWVT